MAEKKEKQYVSDNAQLMEEWDWEKNIGIDPSQLAIGSNKKVWWKCIKGHEWEAIIANRSKHNSGCPYCSGRYVIKGKTDLQTINPTLAEEWNYEKNGNLKPEDVTVSSGKKVWWKCSKEHEWQATIAHRNNGCGCPICAGKKVLKGYNDLQTINPTLAEEWNYEKNNGLTPSEVVPKSIKKVWWKCSKGHEWQARIAHRNNNVGCPICNSERNTSFPEYALVYYFKKYGLEIVHLYREKGYELDIYIPSKKIAVEYDGYFWHKNKTKEDLEKNQKCEKDGIKLYRIREGLSALNDSSVDYIVEKDQRDLSEILEKILSEIVGTKISVDLEKDIVAIENLREYTEKKESLLFSNPRIAKEWNYEKNGNLKPEYFLANSGKKVWWKCNQGHEWQATMNNRNRGRGCPICGGKKVLKGYNDLQTINPTLAEEWNYEKNNGLTPSDVLTKSIKKVWWMCNKGHEWEASIADRNSGSGCPYCSNHKVLKGYNDLQTANPTLSEEWNYEKNKDLTPMEVMPNSNKKVWWKCSKGHEWQAEIYDRNKGGGCPYCSGRYVTKGYNDLQTVNPTLAEEWDYEKNDGLTPADVMPNSNKNVWWKCCKCGHEWQAVIEYRNTNKGRGCPCCAGHKVLKGYNDLQTINPTLAEEWNYEKNGNLKPEDVTVSSGKKVWWKCSKGHEWQARINSRNNGRNCPLCSNKRVLKGYNDLQTINPTLSEEWNYEKNDGLTPTDITANNDRKVWWKCCKGHEWQAAIGSRNKGSGCPYCSGKKAIKGENDLQTINPALADEWNYEKNNGLTPFDVKPSSGKKVWWKCCKCGNEWQSTIANRSKGNGCPECAKQKRKTKERA